MYCRPKHNIRAFLTKSCTFLGRSFNANIWNSGPIWITYHCINIDNSAKSMGCWLIWFLQTSPIFSWSSLKIWLHRKIREKNCIRPIWLCKKGDFALSRFGICSHPKSTFFKCFCKIRFQFQKCFNIFRLLTTGSLPRIHYPGIHSCTPRRKGFWCVMMISCRWSPSLLEHTDWLSGV